MIEAVVSMHCERCTSGHLIAEDLTVCVWRCVNCGNRSEPGRGKDAVDRYQRALVDILAVLGLRTLDCPEIAQAQAIAHKALGV
jgi:hypothetical protein